MRRLVGALALLGTFILGVGYGMAAQHRQWFPHAFLKSLQHPPPGVPGPNSYYAEVVKQLRGFPVRSRVVMLGDSLTEAGRWQAMFSCDSIGNQGISGDTTSGALARVDAVLAARPQVVAVMLGTNDVAWGHELTGIVARYAEIIERLSAGVGSLLIVETPFARQALARNKKISELNSQLRTICSGAARKNCIFVEINAVLAPGGSLDASHTTDGTHFSAKAYQQMRDRLAP